MTKYPSRNKLVHLFDIRAGDSLQHSRGGRVVSRATGWYSLRFGHSYSSHRQGGRHLDCTTSRLTPQRHRDYCLLIYRINNYTFAICKTTNAALYLVTCEMPLVAMDTGILIWWGVWCTSVACWLPAEEPRPDWVETTRTWGREPAARWLTIRAACWDVTGCEAGGPAWLLGRMAPSWGSEGGDTRRTLGEQDGAEAND